MMSAQIISSVISGASLLILAAIARGLLGMRREFHRFMAEHMWLLATTTWTRDKVIRIMRDLGMSPENPPPSDMNASRK